MGEEIPGLNDGVGLVPQGRLGTGIANVFDTDKIAQSLYRLGSRMENIEKLKLASAAKIAAAKAKEKEVAQTKFKEFSISPYGGKKYYNVGQAIGTQIADAGLQQYHQARKAGDALTANQATATTDLALKNISARVQAWDQEDIDFWASEKGKFFIKDPELDAAVAQKIPTDPANINKFFQFNLPTEIENTYINDPSKYDFNYAGDYALKEAGNTTVQKKMADGTYTAMTKASSLFSLPIDEKNKKVFFDKGLEIDYNAAATMFDKNIITRRQMDTYGKMVAAQAMQSEDYKKLATNEDKKKFTEEAYVAGKQEYIKRALQGKATKDVQADLEPTYRRNTQRQIVREVKEKPTPSTVAFTAINRFRAPSLDNPKEKQGFADEISFGPISYYPLDKPVSLSGAQVYPTIDPEILTRLGVISSRTVNGKKYYTLNQPITTQNAGYLPRIDVNQTNRTVTKLGDKSGKKYIHPKGVVLNSGTFPPTLDDDKKSGFVVSDKIQFSYKKLTPEDKEYLILAGYNETDLRQGFINAPLIVDDAIGGGSTLMGEVSAQYKEQAPQRQSFME